MTAGSLMRRVASRAIDLVVALAPPPSRSTAVLVLGMHRSGTSAVTGVLHLMGVPVGAADDLIPADEANAKGYWESGRLTDFQELLLRKLGGGWGAPPPLPQGWERSLRLLLAVGRGRRVFRRVYDNQAVWAWKDPRTCLTLPFWKRALRLRIIAIVVHRNPLEVARSLDVRDGLGKQRALKLWETYNRALLANAEGLPALVLPYEKFLADPVAVASDMQQFLATNGVAVSNVPLEEVREFVDVQLRHSTFDELDLDREPEVTDGQRALVRMLRSLEGAHEALRVEPANPQSAPLAVQ